MNPYTKELTLYATDTCHLCELALSLVETAAQGASIKINVVDILSNDDLYQTYSMRIPVLVRGKFELDWPFSETNVLDFIQQTSI